VNSIANQNQKKTKLIPSKGGIEMLSHRFLWTFIVCGIFIIFAAGCRAPAITSPSGDIAINAGAYVTFSAEFYPNAIYKWTFDGGATDRFGQAQWVQFNRAGVYNVCLTVVFEDFDSGFATRKITVNGPSYGEALVERSGQTTSYRTGDDGDEQAGVSWTEPRFEDNSDGVVTDRLTGLIWLKQANYNSTGGGTGPATWSEAVDFCKALGNGMCGLSDGSSPGDWRLPNMKELLSLIHYGYINPALPNTEGTGQWTPGHPFTNVQSSNYWSATTWAEYTNSAWVVDLGKGNDGTQFKEAWHYYVWPVRGGQ